MMDYEGNIDRLVLGYLKEECKYAHKIFLKAHFSQKKKQLGNHFSTRIAGKTLRDILREYGRICDIIQGKLEETDYYEKYKGSSYSAIKQLNYLLNFVPGDSRSSTPYSASNRSPVSSDIETTPEHRLPKNTLCLSENSYFQKVSKRTVPSTNKSATLVENLPPEKMSEIIAQRLLGRKELHSKLASTINIVRNTEAPKPVEEHKLSEGVCTELDATIRTVLKKTEEDPLFENLIQEIIDGTPSLDSLGTYQSNDSLQNTYRNISEFLRPKTCQNNNNNIGIPSSSGTQNSNEFSRFPNSKPNDVVMFDGNLDNFLKTNSLGMPTQNPILLSANGGILMVPPSPVLQQTSHPQCFIVNNTPQILLNSNKLSAEEIMAMPTVILNDGDKKTASDSDRESKKAKTIAPKPIIEIPVNTGESITLYGGRDEVPKPEVVGLKRTIPPRVRSRNRKTSVNSHENGNENNVEGLKEDQLKTNESDLDSHTSNEEKCTKTKESTSNSDQNAVIAKTPSTSLGIQKPTPKSGSHVRSLDFSSPPKITSSAKKGLKSPQFIHKKQAAKTLFKSKTMEASILVEERMTTRERKKNNAMISQWDKGIREAIGLPTDSNSNLKKKRISISRVKKKAKKPKCDNHNTTDQDAQLLEAALATPEKKQETESQPSDVCNILEHTENTGNTKIMSPSKVTGSKKNVLVISSDTKQQKEDVETLVTPEVTKDTVTQPVLNAKRNINCLLETPVKPNLPKTPGLVTPGNISNILTPYTFSKTIEENFKDVDLNSINTPHFPSTPSFPPFTPGMPSSEYCSRPTDYSATSVESYYQPSDCEHNKSIETILKEEAGRLEHSENAKGEKEKETPQINILSNVVIQPSAENQKEEKHVSLGDHLRVFNKNVIGKKNLNLLSRKSTETTSSESVTSDSDDGGDCDASNKTVICVKKRTERVKSSYSLRTRSANKESSDSKPKTEMSQGKDKPKSAREKLPNKEKNKAKIESAKNVKPNTEGCKENNSSKTANKTKTKPQSVNEPAEKENTLEEDRKTISRDDKCSDMQNYNEKEGSLEKVSPIVNKSVENKELDSKKEELQSAVDDKEDTSENTPMEDIKQIIATVPIQRTLTEEQLIESERDRVIKEMEAKRKRTIDLFKSENKLKQVKVGNRRITPKPKVNVNKAEATKRNKRKPDSPKKSVVEKIDISPFMPDLSSDEDELSEPNKKVNEKVTSPPPEEAQHLIEGLKERGIHLMHNKMPKPVDEDKNDCADTSSKVPEDINEPEHIVGLSEKTQVESSINSLQDSPNLNESREHFDIKIYKKETAHIIFDENQQSFRTFDLSHLSKVRFCKIKFDDNMDIMVPINVTPFHTLMDIQSTVNVLIPRKKKSTEKCTKPTEINENNDERNNSVDEESNCHAVGSTREDNSEESSKSSNTKKRKYRADSSNSCSTSDKKAKIEPGATLLKEINVDLFLDKIHGDGK